MKQLSRLDYWIQRAIPFVYDDTLSLYELVAKTVAYLNNVIESQNDLSKEMAEFLDRFDGDLSESVATILSEWMENGSLGVIINETLFNSKLDKTEYMRTKTDFVDVRSYGAKGDGVTDDTLAFQNCFANELYVNITEGEYLITDTVYIRRYHRIKGVGRGSKILFKGNGNCLLGDTDVIGSSNFNFVELKDFMIVGERKQNQIALNISGFQSMVKNIVIDKFDIGVLVRGVTIDFYDLYVGACNNAVRINDPINNFNTMINFNRCNFMYNTRGLTNVGDGQPENNLIVCEIVNTVFEFNTYPIDMDFYGGSITGCWFEGSTNKPLIRKWKVLLYNNRFEQESDQFEYRLTPYSGPYRGNTILHDNGQIEMKELWFQRYADNGRDEGKVRLRETLSSGLPRLMIRDNNKDQGVVKTTDNGRWSRSTLFTIKPDGTLLKNVQGSLPFTVTKLSIGRYKIKFESAVNIYFNATTSSPSTSGQENGDKTTYFNTVAVGNSLDPESHKLYNLIDYIIIKTYGKRIDNGEDLEDAFTYIELIYG